MNMFLMLERKIQLENVVKYFRNNSFTNKVNTISLSIRNDAIVTKKQNNKDMLMTMKDKKF